MAVLQGDSRIGTQQKAFYRFMTAAGEPLYVHMKTNIDLNYIMFCIEAEGYNYGLTLPILCSWIGYTYGDGSLYNTAVTNYYGGMNAHGIYYSSDSKIVLRAYAGSHYYNGFILNSYMVNPNGYQYRVSITNAIQTSNSGNYY